MIESTFAHLSDPHLTSLHDVRKQDLLNKRLLGYLSWSKRRRVEHLNKVLDALVDDLQYTGPEHILISGDLTHLGLPREFSEVVDWLKRLGTPSQVTVVPGNHDAYVAEAWAQTFAHWQSYMDSDPAYISRFKASKPPYFPSIRVRGPVAFIGLNSARPSAPFLATGSLGHTQLDALDKLLAQISNTGLFRVLLIHHPPTRSAVNWRKCLTDSAALVSILKQHGVDLVLHGHTHRYVTDRISTRTGSTPSIGVSAASAISQKPDHRARYHFYSLTNLDRGWKLNLIVRSYSAADRCFVKEYETEISLDERA